MSDEDKDFFDAESQQECDHTTDYTSNGDTDYDSESCSSEEDGSESDDYSGSSSESCSYTSDSQSESEEDPQGSRRLNALGSKSRARTVQNTDIPAMVQLTSEHSCGSESKSVRSLDDEDTPRNDPRRSDGSASVTSGSTAGTVSNKRYNTASGLPPSCQLRDAQFLKANFPESHWAPDINELNHLAPLMNVQCTMVCSYDPSIRETFWVTLVKVMKKKRANGMSVILIGAVAQNLECCDLPKGSTIILLPKHVQKADAKSTDMLFEQLLEAEQEREEKMKIRPVLPSAF